MSGEGVGTGTPERSGGARDERSESEPRAAGSASAGADVASPAGSAAGAGAEVAGDVFARRAFFRAVASGAVQTAASVIGAAESVQSELRAQAAELAAAAGIEFGGDVLTIDGPASGEAAVFGDLVPSANAGGPTTRLSVAAAYRSPYRVEPDAIIVLDQRRFPGAIVEVPCLSASDAIAAIRDGLAAGPGTIAAVAAYGLARGVAARAASTDADPARTLGAIHADANALLATGPWIVPLRRALDRLVGRAETLVAAAAGDLHPGAVADELRHEADAFAMGELLGLTRLVAQGVELLRSEAAGRIVPGRRLRVLVHGEVGALGHGQLGTAVGALQAAAETVPLFAWVPEGRPSLSGVRAAWELGQAGIGYSLVPDSAVGGLLDGSVDVVLTGALGVTADGSIVDAPGAYAIAALAARHDVPVYVCAPRSALFAPAARPTPHFDVTPAALVRAFVTERGLLQPPFDAALAGLAADLAPGSPAAAFASAGGRAP